MEEEVIEILCTYSEEALSKALKLLGYRVKPPTSRATKRLNSTMALQQITNQNPQRKIYLSIDHGKVVQGSKEEKSYYSSVDGLLEGIYTKTSSFGREKVVRWYIDLRDKEELYSICLPYNSGVFKSIVLALASDEALSSSSPIVIEPYEGKNGYTKVVVYSEGVKLDWITKQLPEVETITVGGKELKDDTKRMQYILTLVNTINERIKK